VLVFHMGVEGVAYATIIAQGISAVLVMITLMRSTASVRLLPRDLRLHLDIFSKIIRVGIPTALQMAVTSFSNVFIQSYINFFGSDCMGGWTAFIKVDQFIILPNKSLGLAATTFVGQNLGSNQPERAKQGVRTALLMSLSISGLIALLVVIFAPHLVTIFNDKPEVVTYGTMFLRYITPCLLCTCVNQVYSGALRGAGNSRAPMLIIMFSYVVFRQCYFFIMSHFIINQPLPIATGYPAGWVVACTLLILYYRHTNLQKNVLVPDNERNISSKETQ